MANHEVFFGVLAAIGLLAGGAGCSRTAADAQPAVASPAPATPAAVSSGTLDYRVMERPLLTNHIQITSRDRFVKAGEAYFDHQKPARWVIFQAVAVPEAGREVETFYAMYVAKLKRDASGHIIGTEDPIKISPDGSANTCGWFHPTEAGRVLFGSTLGPPANNEKSGFQVGTRKYVWMFPSEMEVTTRFVDALVDERWAAKGSQTEPGAGAVMPVFSRPNYDAECSYSKDGRFILYSHVRDEQTRGRPDADLWIYDTKTQKQHEIVNADGYDGGPFFSPDGTMICYRSDRRGDDLLQLFVAKLKFDSAGVPVGIESEHQVTDDEHVNWAPYWHPSAKFLIYGSSGVGHSNYEIFAVEVDLDKPSKDLRKRRVTFAEGADVLPVVSDDGSLVMWTAQRGPMTARETKPSSQLWIAEVNIAAGGFSDPARLFDNIPNQRPEGEPSKMKTTQPAHP